MIDEKKHFTSYALLGSGKLARHLRHYFSLLGLPVTQWSRGCLEFNSFADTNPALRLAKTIENASHLLLAVSDKAIPELAAQLRYQSKVLVHFSGALTVDGVISAHPLMTFGEQLQTLDWYRAIPFVLTAEGNPELSSVLPGLPNKSYSLLPQQRPYYHALCSLAGNSTFLLWQQIGKEFQRLSLPRTLIEPFLHQVVTNSTQAEKSDFTGPVARGDWEVVKKHLKSLSTSPELLRFYQAYLQLASGNGYSVPKNLFKESQPKEREL